MNTWQAMAFAIVIFFGLLYAYLAVGGNRYLIMMAIDIVVFVWVYFHDRALRDE